MKNLNKISLIVCLVILLGGMGCNKTAETTTDSTTTVETDSTLSAADSSTNYEETSTTKTTDPEGVRKCETTDPVDYELCAKYDNILTGGTDAGYTVYFKVALPFKYTFEASEPRFDTIEGKPTRIITLTATKTAENSESIESSDSKKISITEIRDHPADRLIVELIANTDITTPKNEPETTTEKKGPRAIVSKKVILVRTNGIGKKLSM